MIDRNRSQVSDEAKAKLALYVPLDYSTKASTGTTTTTTTNSTNIASSSSITATSGSVIRLPVASLVDQLLSGEKVTLESTKAPVTAASSSSGSKLQSGGWRRTSRGTAPAMAQQAA